MPRFKVRCYIRGIWDQVAPVEIEAFSMMEAAEAIAGQPLCRAAHEDRLRAAVWTAGAIPEATYYYLPPAQHATILPTAAILPFPAWVQRAPTPEATVTMHDKAVVIPVRQAVAQPCTASLETGAERAERYVREGRVRLTRQIRLVAKRRSQGKSTDQAERLLAEMMVSLKQHCLSHALLSRNTRWTDDDVPAELQAQPAGER